MVTSRIWDYSRGLRHYLHEAIRGSIIRRSRQFSDPCCCLEGGASLLLWGAGVVLIGHADCGRGRGADQLVLSILTVLVVIT